MSSNRTARVFKKYKSKAPTESNNVESKDNSLLIQKSPAEFFADNKNFSGFDNPGKCLYTIVSELVENALDSAESISELPFVEIVIEEIGKSGYNSRIGVADCPRIDKELYKDYRAENDHKKRLTNDEHLQKIQAKNASLGKKVKEPQAGNSYYKVSCKDNGRGMPHDDIPNMFGRVLCGTKYGLKQTRGRFGLGVTMAFMSTGLPIKITSSMKGQSYITICELDIDIPKNCPKTHQYIKRDNQEGWHGAEIEIVSEGNWTTYGSIILHYMRQMAVITPYADIHFNFISEAQDKSVTLKFARRTEVMPSIPHETKFHPSAVDLLLIKRLISETRTQNLFEFLQCEFVNVHKRLAERLIREMGKDFTETMPVKSLSQAQIVRIHQLFGQVKFQDPSGYCLSPVGKHNLRLGIEELHPDMVATYSGSARVFEGHPFIVEAGVSIGGEDVKHGLNIFRFANRVPLLFEQEADVVTRTALGRINWNSCKIDQTQDKIGVFVSIVSTKLPFKGTGKEYIRDDIREIADAVEAAIQQCCKQLKSEIVKRIRACKPEERMKKLSKYIPESAGAIYRAMKRVAKRHLKEDNCEVDDSEVLEVEEEEDLEVCKEVQSGRITKQTYSEKLTEYFERISRQT